MSIQEIRQQLHEYIEYADDAKIQALHTLLGDKTGYELSEEDWTILNEEVAEYDAGKGETYTAEESLEIIRNKKKI